jgi:glycosyltransferase involved in cell wall biosynthesis
MRILQIVPNIGIGGAERMLVHLASYLRRKGHHVGVLSLFPPHGNELERQLRDVGVEVLYLGKRVGFDPQMYWGLSRAVRRFRPEIAHSHRYVLRYALPALTIQRHCRGVHTVHTVAEHEVTRAGRVVHRLAFRLGVVAVTIGREVTRSFERVYGQRPWAVIPHGIPVQEFRRAKSSGESWRKREGLPSNAVIFGSSARLAPPKNLTLMLEAFSAVPPTPHPMYLLFAGEGPDRNRLEGRARDLGIQDRVRFLGVRSDIPEFLSAIDVFTLSSLWEGNPLSVMEAMAAGKPVVSTSVGGVPEFVTDGITGRLTQSVDVRELATAMTTLALDGELRTRMGEAGARYAAEHFDVAMMGARYEALYLDLLHNPTVVQDGY